MKPNSFAEQVLFSTIRIGASNTNSYSVGTGFIMSHQIENNKHAYLLVTNRHVVDGFANYKFSFHEAVSDSEVDVGKRITMNVTNSPKFWYFPDNPDIDLALTPLIPLLNKVGKNLGKKIFYRSVSSKMIPTAKKLEGLGALEDLITVGYPMGLLDQKHMTPITRRGITATPVSLPFNGKKQFLIDCAVFKGSSGSPVFLYNPSGYSEKGNLILASRIQFLGVLYKNLSFSEDGEIAEEPQANLSVKFRQLLNLGLVIRSDLVKEVILDYTKEVLKR